jgi:hypothetical protein
MYAFLMCLFPPRRCRRVTTAKEVVKKPHMKPCTCEMLTLVLNDIEDEIGVSNLFLKFT